MPDKDYKPGPLLWAVGAVCGSQPVASANYLVAETVFATAGCP